jgi:hypothetical protein
MAVIYLEEAVIDEWSHDGMINRGKLKKLKENFTPVPLYPL